MKFLRILLKVLLALVVLILLFLAVSLAPVDDTPYQQMAYYRQTKQRLEQLSVPPPAKAPLRAGWAKANITPPYTTPTGGYGARRGETLAHRQRFDFRRAIMLDNGSTKVAIVGLDLLITPPTVVASLKKRLPKWGFGGKICIWELSIRIIVLAVGHRGWWEN